MQNEKYSISFINSRFTLSFTVLGCVMFICSLIVGLMVAFDNSSGIYAPIAILPFVFALSITLSGNAFSSFFKSPVTLFIISGYFIKMVLTPFLFALGAYKSFFPIAILSKSIWETVILMSLENILVFLAVGFFVRQNDFCALTPINPTATKTGALTAISVFLVGFLVFAYFYIPALKEIYIFLPDANWGDLASISFDNETIVARGGIQRYIYSLFTFIWPIVRTILPAALIKHNHSKFGTSTISVVLSGICLLVPSVFLGGDNIAPFFGAIIGAITMIRLYRKKAYKILIVIGIFFSVVFLIIMASKFVAYQTWRGYSGATNFAHVVQAYFPGINNVAITAQIQEDSKWSTLFYDLYYCIPFKETLFGLHGNNLTDLFTEISKTGGQIVPFCAQIAHYMSYFAPIVVVWFVKKAFIAERKSKETDDFWKYYFNMYLSVLIAISLSTYSFSIFLRSFVYIILPVFVIIKLGNRKNIIGNE